VDALERFAFYRLDYWETAAQLGLWRVATKDVSCTASSRRSTRGATVGPQSWLLGIALELVHCDLVDALVAAGARLEVGGARALKGLSSKPDLIRTVLGATDRLEDDWLLHLLDRHIIVFALPCLTGFAPETLKKYYQRAFRSATPPSFWCSSTMLFLAAHGGGARQGARDGVVLGAVCQHRRAERDTRKSPSAL
jgi:hypothetical protein